MSDRVITGDEKRACPRCGHTQPWFDQTDTGNHGIAAWRVIRYCNACEYDFHPEYSEPVRPVGTETP